MENNNPLRQFASPDQRLQSPIDVIRRLWGPQSHFNHSDGLQVIEDFVNDTVILPWKAPVSIESGMQFTRAAKWINRYLRMQRLPQRTIQMFEIASELEYVH